MLAPISLSKKGVLRVVLVGMLVPCHWDFTKKTRARSSGISHIHKNGSLYEPRTHVRQCSGQAGVSISPVAAEPRWLAPATTTERHPQHHQSKHLIQTHA